MAKERTTDLLLERYNYFTRRPTVWDPKFRKAMLKSLGRVLAPFLPEQPDVRVLDVGCGEGALLEFLRTRGFAGLGGIDLSPENVSICHAHGLSDVEQFDALRLKDFRPQDRFDLIFALDLLEHLPKEKAAGFLADARGKLTDGGAVVIQTPNMGCVYGHYHRYNDLSHEFGLTEKTARDLLMLAGFENDRIEVYPAWNATTLLGYMREIYLRLIHRLVFLGDDRSRARIPTKNLLIRAQR